MPKGGYLGLCTAGLRTPWGGEGPHLDDLLDDLLDGDLHNVLHLHLDDLLHNGLHRHRLLHNLQWQEG